MSTCHTCGAPLPAGAAFCPACGARAGAPVRNGGKPIFEYVPHPHIENRKHRAPKPRHPEVKPKGLLTRFNDTLAVLITGAVGTMWCAYLFAALALVSLPDAIKGGTPTLVSWTAQTFLQLVLLSIIIVGQKVESASSETRAIDTYQDAEAILKEAVDIQQHLLAQDALLAELRRHVQGAAAEPPQGPHHG
jgi:hypothetical protein